MQSFVLIGDEKDKKTYIADCIKKENIKPYNVICFEKVKISDVREVKKIFLIKTPEFEKRLLILSFDITIEAQNALLKTLEELPKNVIVIISVKNKDALLSTVLSRSKIIDLGVCEKLTNIEYGVEIIEFVKHLVERDQDKSLYIGDVFLLAEKITLKTEEDEIEKVILFLRKFLRDEMKTQKKVDTQKRTLLFLLKEFCKTYPLIQNNNINKRIAIENIFLSSIQGKTLDL